VLTFGSGEVCLLSVHVPEHLVGRTVSQLVVPGEISVAAITRGDQAFIPALGTALNARDVVHLTVLAEAMERLERWLGLDEGG
jgi:Trk K+ transport system NAD-binding subunit